MHHICIHPKASEWKIKKRVQCAFSAAFILSSHHCDIIMVMGINSKIIFSLCFSKFLVYAVSFKLNPSRSASVTVKQQSCSWAQFDWMPKTIFFNFRIYTQEHHKSVKSTHYIYFMKRLSEDFQLERRNHFCYSTSHTSTYNFLPPLRNFNCNRLSKLSKNNMIMYIFKKVS